MPDDEPQEWQDEANDGSDEQVTDAPSDEAPSAEDESAGDASTEETSADELPADETTGRSPVGAMDRSATELGPAGEGTRPGAAAEDGDSSPEDDSESHDESQPIADAGSDEPLSELRDELSERGEVADEEFEELFEEIDVGTVDEESLWDELSETADEPLFAADADTIPDADVTVVEKSLCHRCPHFGDPPELHCTHEGTTIDAEVDTEHFRVVDCPIVAQRSDVDASDFSTDDL
jgi:hypothetical protein